MDPILLIHGYSAESKGTKPNDIASIYGSLPDALRAQYGAKNVIDINLSRYISLDDGIALDDISGAMDQCLKSEFPTLQKGPFNVIVHSTGALVIRNWIRRFSPMPSPVRTIIYLAGANFGSGWAHIGKGQLAKWGRMVFDHGAERGVEVLDALELGSNATIDLHLHFLQEKTRMLADYKVNECVVIGSEADVSWFPIPIRYAKEDGSDGVVRVSASNLNFNYVRFGATDDAKKFDWRTAAGELRKHMARRGASDGNYEIKETSRPGDKDRPVIPLAIPYRCAHSGKDMGIVIGSGPRAQVLELIGLALNSGAAGTESLVPAFNDVTYATYARALEEQKPGWFKKWIDEPRAQYDKHAQLIFRVVDQNGRPVDHFDVFFDSVQGRRDASLPIGDLFEDNHKNVVTPNIILFYLRTNKFDPEHGAWLPRVPDVNGCFLEVSATEPDSDQIMYLPMRFEFSRDDLEQWLQPHVTTIIDVELLRLPSPDVFRITSFA